MSFEGFVSGNFSTFACSSQFLFILSNFTKHKFPLKGFTIYCNFKKGKKPQEKSQVRDHSYMKE